MAATRHAGLAVKRPVSPCLSEEELAASALALVAQPSLWQALQLPEVGACKPLQAPWLSYWAARLDARLDVQLAREIFAAALTTFALRGDRVGELLCLAAIIEGYYIDEGPLDPLDGWIQALLQRLPAEGQWPSAELEARIIGCGVGIILRDQSHPVLGTWAARGGALMRQLKPGAGRVKLATFLAQFHLWRGEFARTGLVIDALPGLDTAGLLPSELLVWLQTVANWSSMAAQFQRGQDAVAAGLQLAGELGLAQHVYALHASGAALALAAGDLLTAQAHVEAMRPTLAGAPQADQTHYWHFLAGLTLQRGDTARAVELARVALDNSGEIGGRYRTAVHALSLGQALLRAGDNASALAHIDSAVQIAQHIDAALLTFTAGLMRGACLLRLGRGDEALQALRLGWGEGARRDFRTTAVWWLPDVMVEVALVAITHDIEPAYVRSFVRQRALPGPDPALVDWPWPLVLRGFGEFEARLHDAPFGRSSGKTAQRPLDLLRVLVAHGQGALPVAHVLDWLWPEAEPSAQRKAFDVALLRLRRLLDAPHLLHLEGGRLWLDPRWVWTDVSALQVLTQRIGSAAGATLPQLQAWARQLLELMRGPFMAAEEAEWAQAPRARHRQRFVLAVAQLAGQIELLDTQAAIRLYESGLDADPLAESLSRRLMRLHVARGDQAEALRVWRSCRTLLLVTAGLGPSQETRALAAQLGLPAS